MPPCQLLNHWCVKCMPMAALHMHIRLPRQAGKSSRVYRSNGNLSISREMHMKHQLVHKQRDEQNTMKHVPAGPSSLHAWQIFLASTSIKSMFG